MNNLGYSENYVWIRTCALGRGAFGSVYQGMNKNTGDEVAVKTFKCDAYDPLKEKAMREFEVMKDLSHENIVKMVAIEDEIPVNRKVLIMELCRGGNLQAVLGDPQNTYGLEEKEFLCVLKDLTAGLKYLRDNKIVHRDLKPANMMKHISEDGCFIYKLTDFGCARYLKDDEQYQSMVGTVEYLHPDMLKIYLQQGGEKAFRATTDLWSIGTTIYQLATGSLPFRAFGGRKNMYTMFLIYSQKPPGFISGVQHEENEEIEWSKELPKTCLLNQGLRDLLAVLLAGIFESDPLKVWTFDQFFESVRDIISRKIFHVFYANEGKEVSLYMQPDKMLQDLKNEISSHTDVRLSSQLLFDKFLFLPQIDSSSDVSQFPNTTLDQPLILVHMEKTDLKDTIALESVSAFPLAFPSSLNSAVEDAALAQTCCSKAYAVKRLVVKLVRCQEILLHIPKISISLSSENVSKLCSDLEVLKSQVDAISHRSELLKKTASVYLKSISAWPNITSWENLDSGVRNICKKIKVLEKRTSVDEVKKKFAQLESSVYTMKQQVLISKYLQSECEQTLSECSSLDKCVELANTYVEKIRDSWQVFMRHVGKKVLPPSYQKFHMLERLKIQKTNSKLYSLLLDVCLNAHKQTLCKLNDWYSVVQTNMTQCKCLGEDLHSVTNELTKCSSSLLELESELYELATQVIFTLTPKDSSLKISPNLCNSNHQNQVPEILKKLQAFQKVQQGLREVSGEQTLLLKRFDSFFQNVHEDLNMLKGNPQAFSCPWS